MRSILENIQSRDFLFGNKLQEDSINFERIYYVMSNV